MINWNQHKEIKSCIVKDNILFEKYNRTELPERIVYDDGLFSVGKGNTKGSDLEIEIKSFYREQLRKELGIDFNKEYFIHIHKLVEIQNNIQNNLIDIDVLIDDPVWKEYTGGDRPYFYSEEDWEKVFSSLSIANSTTVKIILKDQKYRINNIKADATTSKINEWNDKDGTHLIRFDSQPSQIFLNVKLEPNPYWQSVKYILNEKFDCGILVTFADGTQQMRKEIPDLGSMTITIVENPQFRDDVCNGMLQSKSTVSKESKD